MSSGYAARALTHAHGKGNVIALKSEDMRSQASTAIRIQDIIVTLHHYLAHVKFLAAESGRSAEPQVVDPLH